MSLCCRRMIDEWLPCLVVSAEQRLLVLVESMLGMRLLNQQSSGGEARCAPSSWSRRLKPVNLACQCSASLAYNHQQLLSGFVSMSPLSMQTPRGLPHGSKALLDNKARGTICSIRSIVHIDTCSPNA